MAEAMIEVILETLTTLIQNQLFAFLGVDAEMRRLSSLLSTIKAVLEDAEEKQFTDQALNNWLRKLRDEVHLLDDILDECQHKVQQAPWFYSFFNPTHVMFRYKTAKKLKNISQRLYEISEERLRFHLHESVPERRDQVMEWRQTSSIITQPHFYGRDGDKERIVDFLVGDALNLEELLVYPIVGIGGLGKTSLAQQVFNDERVVEHFELRIWVCVSDDFNLRRLSKAIIEAVTTQACGDLELEPLQRRLQEVLGRKRYLLVLDDVWNDNQEKWNRLKYALVCGSKGSSILVTTRLTKVASIIGTMPPHELSLLSEDHCWELFRQRAFGTDKEERLELVAIGKDIVKKCKGVPLAAKTLGSLLRFLSDTKDWLRIKESGIWNLPQEDDSILPALRLSYLNLPSKLRQCFAYLAVFPKDYRMSKRQIVELWMSNGFISSNKWCEAEDDGDIVWNELYLRSFFEDVEINKFSNNTWFKMHDLVHDLAQLVAEEECYYCTIENDPPGERTHHLSFYVNDPFQKPWSPHLQNIRSLKTFITTKNCVNNTSLHKCHSLRALDLKLLKVVPSSVDHLKHLRYLNLSNGFFKTLPSSICRLHNLQILNLNNCRMLKKLPNQLKCLKSLRHLHLDECASLFRLAPQIGQLTFLKTLKIYFIGMQKGFLLEEIENLKLEGTLHIKNLERVASVMDAKKANLANKRLNELKLTWEKNKQSQLQEHKEKILEFLQPHVQLRTLVIEGYLGTQLPQWMANPMLKDLSCLEFVDCKNLLSISSLGKLPSLKRLTLWNMNHVQYIDESDYIGGAERAFQSLEFLRLERLPSLIKLQREDGDNTFPHLSTLQIFECPQLNLPFLPSVTELRVRKEWSMVTLGSIQNLPNLEFLCLAEDNELTSFPDEMLNGLKYLKTLHINRLQRLEVLPTGLANLSDLQELIIMECNNLETINEEVLQGLCSLKRFNISGHPKFKLCAGFQHLIALEDLTIQRCLEVQDIHDALQHNMNLRSLRLYNLPNLASLPHWLGNLRLLESLQISECPKLMSLPMSFQSLTNLKYLHIWNCPELQKRCMEETGEDWHKIAHVSSRSISNGSIRQFQCC